MDVQDPMETENGASTGDDDLTQKEEINVIQIILHTTLLPLKS